MLFSKKLHIRLHGAHAPKRFSAQECSDIALYNKIQKGKISTVYTVLFSDFDLVFLVAAIYKKYTLED
jgi:hypothetical protein